MSEKFEGLRDFRSPDERQWALNAGFHEAHAFIQWKGTDVCMDFRCTCGARPHFDGMFAYAVKCADCGTVWEMPSLVFVRQVEPGYDGCVQNLDGDDDD